ncbi:MAG: hypothetical protein AAGU05_00060 [Anaerolineaceae bacterium]
MNTVSYASVEKIRFLAANFSRLQGLRAVPIGLLLFSVSYWANRQSGPAADLSLPILLGVVCLLAAVLAEQYYRRAFGRVKPAGSARRADWLVSAASGVAALAAFIAETRFDLPFSPVGLVFAAVLWVEYIRFTRYSRNWYTTLMLMQALLVGLLSILPVLGLGQVWHRLGVKADLPGICMAVGLLLAINGLISHWFFMKTLPKEA